MYPNQTAATRPSQTLNVFGFDISNVRKTDAASSLVWNAQQCKQTCVAFLNADCINKSYSDREYRRVLNTFDVLYSDGVGMRWATKLQGHELIDNVNGTDLFPVLLDELASKGRSIFLLGGRPGRAAKVAEYIKTEFPGVSVRGHHHGYLNKENSASVFEKINESKADVLLVAMGAPRQEGWIAEHKGEINIPVMLGVGGLFDYFSGAIPRAPSWIRAISLEWVWRLAMEPRAKAQRYLIGNLVFIVRALLEANRRPRSNKAKWSMGRLRVLAWRVLDYSNAMAKRVMDVVLAGSAAALLSPLLITTALLIRLESPGSCLFSQIRVGKNGKEFRMYKLRSMFSDAEARRSRLEALNEMQEGVIFKMRQDPRITRVGRVIRKLSIDELPQLWNVLVGDMSLVGPRPSLPSETAQYTTEDRYRLQCKPGITCFWQVMGRSSIPFDQQVELDLRYIREKSFWTDLRILLKTVPAVLSAKGAF